MGHNLRALIGKPQVVGALATRFRAVRRVPLPQGFEMVPLVDRQFDQMAFSPDATNPESAVDGWSRLGSRVEELLADLARLSPVAYIYTEYFGGVGEQAALVFVDGRSTPLGGGSGRALLWSSSTGPINDALAAIGVVRDGGSDEFDSLGLGQYRSIGDWEERQ